MNQQLRSYLQYKALSHRFSAGFAEPYENSIDNLLDLFQRAKGSDQDVVETLQLQNVCAKMPFQLVSRLESNLEILSMSKREFIEIAIISALDEVGRIFAEIGIPIPGNDGSVEGVSE